MALEGAVTLPAEWGQNPGPAPAADWGDVHRPRRRHPAARTNGAPSSSPTRSGTSWRPEGPSATSPSWYRRSSCSRATRSGCTSCGRTRCSTRWPRTPRAVLSVADDWAFIPSSWKAIGEEDPALGIPTTYYGAVQLVGRATVHDCAHGSRARGGHPAAAAGDVPARRGSGRPGGGAHGQAARDPRDRDRGSSRSRPSSSTAATWTRPIGGPWSIGCDGGTGRGTKRQRRMSCVGWRVDPHRVESTHLGRARARPGPRPRPGLRF